MEVIIAQVVAALSNPAVISVAMVVLEMIMRLVPSQQPLSVLHVVASVMHIVGKVIGALADFLDKILPQNVAKQ